ncbi:MAG: isochorismate synthase MenF [Acidimicrobiales bacterium]
MRPEPDTLRAVSVALPGDIVDPVGVCGSGGILVADGELALAGRGEAAALDLPRGLEDPGDLAAAAEWLAKVPHTGPGDRPGAVVRAFGALPFDRAAPARLVVPELSVGRDAEGRCWATLVAAGDSVSRSEGLADQVAGLARDRRAGARDGAGGDPEVHEVPSPAGYARSVERALAAILEGPVRKVVLARRVDARFAAPVDVPSVLGRLWAQEPSCTIFSFPGDTGGGRFLGASPELLVRRRGDAVGCHPLAGTVGLGPDGDPGGHGGAPEAADLDDLLSSAKDRLEHELVVEAIVEALAPRCTHLDVPSAPSLVRLRTVAHLGTVIEGTLRAAEGGRTPSVLELLADLHPTPAVGGLPRSLALACIAELEPAGRGLWAGPVGWVDAAGDGRWVIGIRSATVEGSAATLTAGAGIVAGSDPWEEVAETTVKLASVLDALSPGSSRLL